MQDLHYAIRSLRKSRTFTLAAVATLAIGIGAATAVFALANAVLLEPLQAPGADRIVRFQTVTGDRSSEVASAQQFDYWRSQSEVFEDVTAHRLEFVNVTDGGDPEHVAAARVSAAFFRLFGVPMELGRPFTVDEDQPDGPRVAILGHDLWVRRFGANPEVVGRSISLGAVPYTIVGVVGAGFDTEQFDARPDVWVPFQHDVFRVDSGDLSVVTGRLRAGVSLDEASERVRAADEGFAEYRAGLTGQPAPSQSPTSQVRPLIDVMVGGMRSSIDILFLAVGLLLLIACANVANLLLARGAKRRSELAIRAALGAGRGRLLRQLLAEALMLSMAGGALGLVLGRVVIRAVLRVFPAANPMLLGANPATIPRIGTDASAVTVDGRVLLFTLAASVVATLLFGLWPAFASSGGNVTRALKQRASSGAGFRQSRIRTMIVAGEVALAMTLLVGAALLVQTFRAYLGVETGFDPNGVMTMRTAVGGTTFDTREGMETLTREGLERVRALPGVVSAGMACCVPLETVWQLPFVIQSRPEEGLRRSGNLAFHGFGGWTFVSPGYFESLDLPLVRGRRFTDQDTYGAPGVVVINETMARRYWPDSDPLTDRLAIGQGMGPEYAADPIRQVVGIVADAQTQGLTSEPRPEMYVPVSQVPSDVTSRYVGLLPIVWFARTRGAPQAVAESMSSTLEDVSGLAVARVRSMNDIVAEFTGRTRFDMWLLTLFGGSALLLSVVGVYGLATQSVQEREREIGIRLAIGAAPVDVRNMLLRQGMEIAVTGIAVGSVASLGLGRVMAGLLFGVSPREPLVFVTVSVLLGTVAMAALWIPAHRSTRLQPMTALRAD